MTYSEAIEFLHGLQTFGANFGLENTTKLAARAGDPQNQLRFIHVAGTNGKGSTCAMLESIYHTAGLRVGLYTSPHLVSFRERIQINRQLIHETDVARLVDQLRELSGAEVGAITFFEFITVLALRHFAEQRCDLVIWETGLGGRLDATNIVTPLASVITNVQFDHQQWLGDTLPKIAAEKAGIIKPRVPVITATNAPEALAVIRDQANACAAPLTIVTTADASTESAATIPLPLLGQHQRLNAALALATVKTMTAMIPVRDETMVEGLRRVEWAGRLQFIERPGQTVLLDGAHNVAGAEALRAAWQNCFADRRATLLLGVLRDKDWSKFCSVLAPLAERILLTPVPSERTATPRELAEVCRQVNPHAAVMVTESLNDALTMAASDSFVVVTGSLYLVGEALEILRPTERPGDERDLNEWNPRRSAAED